MEHFAWQFILQLFTVAIIPLVKIWFDNSNKQMAKQFEQLNKEVKSTQDKVDEVTQIGLQNRASNKSIISYRLHKEFGEALELGFTTREDYEELSALYASYKNIGGNGKIEALYNRFKELPIKK
ncbi:MAG: hypothetical protein E6446_01665 [Gemella haemolysans]|nr:hypothetical protein [Gemella haemolysans]